MVHGITKTLLTATNESHLNLLCSVRSMHEAVQNRSRDQAMCQGQKSNNESEGGIFSEGAGADEKQ